MMDNAWLRSVQAPPTADNSGGETPGAITSKAIRIEVQDASSKLVREMGSKGQVATATIYIEPPELAAGIELDGFVTYELDGLAGETRVKILRRTPAIGGTLSHMSFVGGNP